MQTDMKIAVLEIKSSKMIIFLNKGFAVFQRWKFHGFCDKKIIYERGIQAQTKFDFVRDEGSSSY